VEKFSLFAVNKCNIPYTVQLFRGTALFYPLPWTLHCFVSTYAFRPYSAWTVIHWRWQTLLLQWVCRQNVV